MLKFLFISIFFIIPVAELFSQVVEFKDYRYKYIDTNNVKDFVVNKKSDSLIIKKYTSLFLRKNKPEYLYLLNNIALDYINRNNDKKAKQIIENNIKISTKTGINTYEKAYALYLLQGLYAKKRDYKQLAGQANMFNSIIEKLNADSTLKCIAYNNSSKWNFAARNIKRGFQDFDISNKLASDLGLTYILQDNYTNAGNILSFYEPEQASKFLNYALQLSKSNPYNSPVDLVYLHLITGASYMARDNFDKAIENFQYALSIMKRDSIDNNRFESVLNFYIASSYKWQKKYNKAIKQAEFFKKDSTYSYYGLNILGEVYFLQKKYDTARIFLKKYYKTFPRQSADNYNIKALLALNRVAVCNMHTGNMQMARKQFRKCLFYMAGESDRNNDNVLPSSFPAENSSYYYWHNFLASYTYFIQKEYLKGENYDFNDVVNCYLTDINTLNNKIFIKNNQASKFMFSNFAKETSMQLLNFLSTQKDIPLTILTKVWSAVAFSKNNYLNAKLNKESIGLALKTSEQQRYDSLTKQLDALINISESSSRDVIAEQLDCYKNIFVMSYDKKAELLYPSINLNVDIKAGINSINDDEAIMDFYSNDSSIYFFSYKDSNIEFHRVKNAEYTFNLIKYFNRKTRSGEENDASVDGQIMELLGFNNILKPDYSLYFIPDNNMATFPIEVLKCSNNKYLIENNEVSYLYSVNQLINNSYPITFVNQIAIYAPAFLQNNYSSNEVSLVDNRNMGDNNEELSALPFSVEESKQIDSVLNITDSNSLKLYYEATINNFLVDASQSRIIHIASHGKASKSSIKNTGIYLYNNEKSIELLTFDKIKTKSIKAELVVLSACKTTYGTDVEGEGKLSLAYGFMFAGAKNVVASLWYVSDKYTQELMLDFYKNIKDEEINFSQAMRKAKIEHIKNGYSPLDWGSFIIIGKR